MELRNDTHISQYLKVKEFMDVMGQATPDVYTAPTPALGLLRYDLIRSELYDENELFYSMRRDNVEKVLDGILDVLYVAYGALLAFGIKLDEDYLENTKPFSVDSTRSQGVMCTYGDYRQYEVRVESIMEDIERSMMYEQDHGLRNDLFDLVLLMQKIGSAMNFDIASAFDEVHASNMSKACKTEADAQASVLKYEDTEGSGFAYYMKSGDLYVIHRSSDGKVLKGIDFFEPDLSKYCTACFLK